MRLMSKVALAGAAACALAGTAYAADSSLQVGQLQAAPKPAKAVEAPKTVPHDAVGSAYVAITMWCERAVRTGRPFLLWRRG